MSVVELFDVSLPAEPAGVVLAIVAALSFRSGWSLLTALFGGLIGGLLGRLAWELFANKAVGFDFGSEFEGFDWVGRVRVRRRARRGGLGLSDRGVSQAASADQMISGEIWSVPTRSISPFRGYERAWR
jgi:hypothetical protein